MNYIKLLITVLAALSFSTSRAAEPSKVRSGRVTHVTDGDTLWVKVDGHDEAPVKVRLRNIDAPEICQAAGAEARRALEARVLNRPVRFRSVARDKYERVIADVSVDGEDVAGWLVRQGLAWSPGFHHAAGRWSREEQDARRSRRGLFSQENAIEPSVFRKLHGPCEPVTRRARQ